MINNNNNSNSSRNYYAFAFSDGTNTTTGDGPTLRTAGQLYRFKKASDRDEYVALWHKGRIVHSVSRDEIPFGHTAADAEELFAFEGGFATEEQIALREFYSEVK